MGYALSWLAIKGKDSAAILKQLQFEETSQKEEFPVSDLSAIQLGEWYIIVGHEDWYVNLYNFNFATLSKKRQLVFCNVDERVMYCMMEWWADGKQECGVEHQSAKGVDNLVESGSFPERYQSIKAQILAEQKSGAESGRNEVDYIFDIPIELAHSIVGYRHDRVVEGSDPMFTVLLHNPKLKQARFNLEDWIKQQFLKFIWYPIVNKRRREG